MYQVNDLVLYGVHGVCKILEVQMQTVNRKKTEYFVLEPISQQGSRFFVPTKSEVALSKLRCLISKEEIMALLASPESHREIWLDDENQRKQQYKDVLTTGDRAMLLCLLRLLDRHRELQADSGKKFHISDANFMRDAQKIIFSEFSLVLGTSIDVVEQYIKTL